MTYRALARLPIVPGESPSELRTALERANKTINRLMDQVDLLTAQSDTKQIQGVEISTTAPTDNQVLTYNAGTETAGWETP